MRRSAGSRFSSPLQLRVLLFSCLLLVLDTVRIALALVPGPQQQNYLDTVLREFTTNFHRNPLLQGTDTNITDMILSRVLIKDAYNNQIVFSDKSMQKFNMVPLNFIENFVEKLNYHNKRKDDFSIIISLFVFPPSYMERKQYAQLPISKTLTNGDITKGLTKGYPEGWDWGNVSTAHWVMPESHRRQQRQKCMSTIADNANRPAVLHPPRLPLSPWYLAYTQYGVIHPNGVLALQDNKGLLQPRQSCSSHDVYNHDFEKWSKNLTKYEPNSWQERFSNLTRETGAANWDCNCSQKLNYYAHFYSVCDFNSPMMNRFEHVFMASSYEDNNYYHFLTGGLIRLVRAMTWLQENPQIKIHLGHLISSFPFNPETDYYNSGALRARLLEYFGISKSRIVQGFVFAKHVYFSRPVYCDEPEMHAGEILMLAEMTKFIARDTEQYGAPSFTWDQMAHHHHIYKHPTTASNSNSNTNSKREEESVISSRRTLLSSADERSNLRRRSRGFSSSSSSSKSNKMVVVDKRRRSGGNGTGTTSSSGSTGNGQGDGEAGTLRDVLGLHESSRRSVVLISRIKEWTDWNWRELEYAAATQGFRSWDQNTSTFFEEQLKRQFPEFDMHTLVDRTAIKGGLLDEHNDTVPITRFDNASVVAAKKAAMAQAEADKAKITGKFPFCASTDMACRVNGFTYANILVGAHGAGLTNILFMPPGSLLVEIVMQFNGVALPTCGSFGRLCAVLGIHHLSIFRDSQMSNFSHTDARGVAAVTSNMWHRAVAQGFPEEDGEQLLQRPYFEN